MTSKFTAINKLLNGVMKYRKNLRPELLEQYQRIRDKPAPNGILVTCVDSRLLTSRITQAEPGDFFILRNPGNLVPAFDANKKDQNVSAQDAALELACYHNDVRTGVVCGHSDCKAVNLVYSLRNNIDNYKNGKNNLLRDWLMKNSINTVHRFLELERNDFKKPLQVNLFGGKKIQAFIDPKNEFEKNDKLSQISLLLQLENFKGYDFIEKKALKDQFELYALWFDVYSGDLHMFSYDEKCFVKIDDFNFDKLKAQLK